MPTLEFGEQAFGCAPFGCESSLAGSAYLYLANPVNGGSFYGPSIGPVQFVLASTIGVRVNTLMAVMDGVLVIDAGQIVSSPGYTGQILQMGNLAAATINQTAQWPTDKTIDCTFTITDYACVSQTVTYSFSSVDSGGGGGGGGGSYVGIPATNQGADFDCIDDIDAAMHMVSDPQTLLTQSICRRLGTPRGALVYAPDYGIDLRAYCNMPMTDAEVSNLQRTIERECLKDERVDSATASVTLDEQTQSMQINIELDSEFGDFSMILDVSEVTVALLRGGE